MNLINLFWKRKSIKIRSKGKLRKWERERKREREREKGSGISSEEGSERRWVENGLEKIMGSEIPDGNSVV